MENKNELSSAASRFAGENPLTVAMVVGVVVAIAAGQVGLPILIAVTAAALGVKAMSAGITYMASTAGFKTVMTNLRKEDVKADIVEVDKPAIKNSPGSGLA